MSAARGSTAATTTQEPPITVCLLHRYGLRLILSVVLTVGLFPGTVTAHYVESSTQIIETTLPLDCSLSLEISCKIEQEKVSLVVPPVVSGSSMAEPVTVNDVVVGSNPTQRANLTVNSTSGDRYGTATKLYADRTNNCVLWAENQTGIHHVLGNGARKAIQGSEPKVGAIASLKGSIPHAGVVTAVNGDQITISESNYIKNWVDSRTLPLSMFIGFVYY